MSSLTEIKKYEDLSFGQWKALATKCGGLDNVLAILRGEKNVRIQLEEILLKLFDKNGRRIPDKNLKNAVCDPNKDFYLEQPQLETLDDFSGRLIRFQEFFHPGPFMSVSEFQARSQELIKEIENNENLVNLLKGIHLPIILPKLENFEDYGETLEKVFLPAVKLGYERQFPEKKFHNCREKDLKGKVGIVEGSRHEKLLEKMKQNYVVGIYFPNPFQGFSVLASREQMTTLPESFLLAGGFDSASAQAMYPDVLARDYHTLGYDLSALIWQSPDYSLHFGADDGRLSFVGGALLGGACGGCSSGLFFLGSA